MLQSDTKSRRHIDGRLDCTVRFLFKPSSYGPRVASVLKLRSYAVEIMDLHQETFPRITNLFLYREAVGVVSSYSRLLRGAGVYPEHISVDAYLERYGQILGRDLSHQTALLDAGATEVSIPEQLNLMWLSNVERYLAHHAHGAAACAVRYEDLISQREQVIGAILASCGLSAAAGPGVLEAFARDAQEGTMLARAVPDKGNQERLTTAEVAAMARILARHPVVTTATFIVPGTLCH
jgi:hypothetical protein